MPESNRVFFAVAKEQGYRSRAAFKLVQINRKHNVLESCRTAVLDLCAAPGGWTQVAARTCPSSCQIVAVDILPIRRLGDRRVTTIVGDITTDKCRADIQRALNGNVVDLVLHDGAPNIGAEYGKDAFVQNELALAALRTAIQHLKPNGTFITKVYRSRDYHALHWAISQLFDSVAVHKPSASRQQSAEIFLIGIKYKAPKTVDSRLTDPKYVFATVEGDDATGANASSAVSVFSAHQPKRQRQGYDTNHYSFTSLRRVEPVRNFIEMDSVKQAIQLLSTSTEFCFTCDKACQEQPNGCPTCAWYKQHASNEIQEQCSDLKLLSKSDFKKLLLWRNKLHETMEEKKKYVGKDKDSDAESDGSAETDASDDNDTDEEDEEAIQEELQRIKDLRAREAKRRTKKERRAAATRRRQAAIGMDLNAIDITNDDNIFSLSMLGKHELSTEVNLDQVTDEQIFGTGSDDEDVVLGGEDDIKGDDAEALRLRRERDLDEAYAQYLQNTKTVVPGTKTAKRSKKLERKKLIDEAHEDQEMAMTHDLSYNVKTYAKLLHGNESDDDEGQEESDDESDDGFNAAPMTPAEHRAVRQNERNPLMHQFREDEPNSKTARWFSNPLFATIENAAAAVSQSGTKMPSSTTPAEEKDDFLTADDVIASMPKTDKQKRHEKRLKQLEKDARKKARKATKQGKSESEFQLVPSSSIGQEEDEEEGDRINLMTDEQKKRELEARELIKAGLGATTSPTAGYNSKLVVVPEEEQPPLPRIDERKYDSDEEDYDSDDHARTLAIGTMILRRSKEKAFVDASYNRYAWNDPSNLPEWFVDDETRNYRPQLPVPPALVAKMKEKMLALSTKPIAKVAEARARKSRRAKLKLAAAKKKAESVANANDMTESMKLKAISQALRGQEAKRPGKTYVVAKKGRANKGGKGTKLVDKRMKNDKRALDRSDKKRKKGKQGGLVGSKKRRNHK